MASSSGETKVYLGVDAGGTKTQALVATRDRSGMLCIIGQGKSGPGNPLSCGLEAAAAAICDAVTAALATVAGNPTSVVAVAGAASEGPREELKQRFRQHPALRSCEIVPDVAPLFAYTRETTPTLAVVVGTGSSLFIRQPSGTVTRYGGWGHLLGDEGSGYRLGRAALRHALRNLEDGSSQTELTHVVLKALGCVTYEELLTAVYSNPTPRTYIASLAARLMDLDAHGDLCSREIVQDECDALANAIARACNHSGLKGEITDCVLTGSIVVHNTRFRARLLEQSGQRFRSVQVVREPAEGCLLLASDCAIP